MQNGRLPYCKLNCDGDSIIFVSETSFKEDLGADSLDLFVIYKLVMAQKKRNRNYCRR